MCFFFSLQALFAVFQSSITDPDVVESFKQVSQLYINGAYKALPYYEHCQVALGDKFDGIFPELLVLLPDIGKQQVNNNYSSSAVALCFCLLNIISVQRFLAEFAAVNPPKGRGRGLKFD